ncbi:MAG TPA: PA2779 family protein [Syntrophorhabdales bacterium]|nr:PA2779 family protein [Syntrophorhabdales bacterium]
MVKKWLACYLVIAMFIIGVAPRVDASFSPSEALNAQGLRTGDIEKIRIVLENKLVAQRLRDLGYSTDEVMTRLSEMSDSQIHGFAQKLDDLKVGKDVGEAILFVLVVIILVVVILQLTGHKIIVSK